MKAALEGNFEPYSTPSSPLIDRQEISWSLERDLRQACEALVKSAGSGSEPKSDNTISLSQLVKQKHAMNKKVTAEKAKIAESVKAESSTSDKKSQSSSRSKLDTKSTEPQSAISEKIPEESPVLTALPQFVVKQKSTIPADFPVRRDSLSNKKTPTHRLPKTTLNTKIVEEYSQMSFDGSQSGTDTPPRSSSTDHPLSASTAMTSVAITPLMKSFAESPRQGPLDLKTYQSTVSRADTKAMEWMNIQKQKVVEEPSPQKTRSRTATTESNSSNFASSLRNMFRGRSRSRSREPSARPGSRLGETVSTIGRQFSLRKQMSTTSLVDTAKEQGPRLRYHKSSGDLKAEVDLNRKLPPLPGLDTYKGPENDDEPEQQMETMETTVVKIPINVRPKSSSVGHATKPLKPVLVHDTAAVKASVLQHKRSISMKSTAVPLPTEPARKMSLQSSADSCFTPATSHTPSRSVDVAKAAHKAKSIENLQQLKNSIPQPPTPKSTRSAATSRPVSRGSSKAPAKYSIIPHQRAPSHTFFSSKSAASSMYHLPPRPHTRDAPTPQYPSSRPSLSSPSIGKPAVNFSRKYPIDVDVDTASVIGDTKGRLGSTSSPSKKSKKAIESPIEITALPPMPSKRKGIRRMLSSVSLGVTKLSKSSPEKNVWAEHQQWRQAPSNALRT